MLVERIAESPEVRAAIAEQGVGLITDMGRRLTAATERLDDALERVAHRLMRRPPVEEETTEVGMVTRIAAAAIDLGLVSAAFWIGSGLLAAVIPVAFSATACPGPARGAGHAGLPHRWVDPHRILGAGGPDARRSSC